MLPAGGIDVRNGVFQGISGGSAILGVAWFGVLLLYWLRSATPEE